MPEKRNDNADRELNKNSEENPDELNVCSDENHENLDECSDEELEELIHQYDQLEKEFAEMEAACQGHLDTCSRESIGPLFDVLRGSKEQTINHLDSSDAKVRQAAIQLAYDYWDLTDAPFAREYERLAFEDPDIGVRGAAILALGASYARTKDRRIGHVLAALARDPRSKDEIRIQAFTALLDLHGFQDYHGSSSFANQTIAGLDWAFINQYYDESRELAE